MKYKRPWGCGGGRRMVKWTNHMKRHWLGLLLGIGCVAWPAVIQADTALAKNRAVERTNVTAVWVVFKTHFDIGYTDLVTTKAAGRPAVYLDLASLAADPDSRSAADRRAPHSH
jgi:hypothetical protein